MISTLAVENYRSLRRLIVPLTRLNVITGANGTGKSSLYRSLRLLAESARGGAVAALAQEGGLPSVLWAGPETIGRAVREGRHAVQGTVRSGPVSLQLGFAGDEFGYAVDFGHPSPSSGAGEAPSMFNLDPEIKRESIWSGPVLRPAATLSDRAGAVVKLRGASGSWSRAHGTLRPYDSMLGELADPSTPRTSLRSGSSSGPGGSTTMSAPTRTPRPAPTGSAPAPPCSAVTAPTWPPPSRRSARSVPPTRWTRPWTRPSPAAGSRSPTWADASGSVCASTACCAR